MRIWIGAFLGWMIFSIANAADFTLHSPAFREGDHFPRDYSCDGNNAPPTLSWANAPQNTKSFALIFYSPDPVIRAVFYNWVLYDIPSNITSLPMGADLPEGTSVGNNSLGETTYTGPCPPDSLLHHYIFTLYALDKKLYLPSGTEIDEVLVNIKNHILKKTELKTVFSH